MRTACFILAAVLLLSDTALSQSSRRIAIGSKNFTESRLLAEILAQLIEARADIAVERRTGLGGTMVVFSALRKGDIDIYPEYTGTAWSIILKRKAKAPGRLRTYLTVRSDYRKRFGLIWTQPFGFSNSYAVAIRKSTAERLGIQRLSDLTAHSGEVTAGWSLEFLNREDGWPGLSRHYDLKLKKMRGMEHGLAYEAIRSGNIDLTDAYTTDGRLLKFPIRLLEDDKAFFPPYECAAVVRSDTLKEHPELEPLLDEMAFRITDRKMQKLNFEVEEEGRPFAEVASDFLRTEKLVGADQAPVKGETIRGRSLGEFIAGRVPVTVRLIGEHLLLTGIAVFLAILVAVPLGIFLTRREGFRGAILGTAGVIQTIPSLALLAFMIPIPGFGLSMKSAVAALLLYSLLPILRNTYTGIKQIDPDLIEAAKGMGLTDLQTLRFVELPLAIPTIMAGVRTAAVISIGIATLAAFIGAGGLGEPIITGLQLNEPRLILSGAIPAALLAIGADQLLGWADKALSPGR